ncbi:AsmA family protein [Phenylobacterium sp.]|uniref:AsmA family protein n=1 Tax=Phenylobacterium sp. TaxID=1871053 RepID=UPI00301C2CB4
MSQETARPPSLHSRAPAARDLVGRARRRFTRRPDRRPPQAAERPRRRRLAWAGGLLALLAIVIAVLIAVWDWNWFRGPLERTASTRLDRRVTISGDLHVDLFSWRPTATVDGITIANPEWAGTTPMGTIERLRVRIRLVPLLWGKADLRVLAVDRPNFRLLADGQGRQNWDFSPGRQDPPADFPPIQNFVIREGRLEYSDAQRNIRFLGLIEARERLGAGNTGFQLTGDGTINGQPFRAEVTGGPLVNVERDQPYPFDVDLRAGRTHVTANGAIPRPFDLGRFQMNATIRGPDLADLFPITGVALPNTPPYALRGRLSRAGFLWKVDGLSGRVGDSDLAGVLSVETGRERPLLKAELQSRSLDFDDLGAVFGAAPKAGSGETASAEQAAAARRLVAQQRLFPDTPLDVRRIRAMDADVTYRAASIRDTPIELRAGSVRVRLDDGLLRADPLRLDLPHGRVEGHVTLNARGGTPATALDLRLSNARIESLVPVTFQGSPPFEGALVGRARLAGRGDSVRKTFATADGEVVVVAPGGEIRRSVAELMGVNVVKGLGLLLSKDSSTTPIRCGVAHFQARNGVMRADSIVLDTGPVLVTGRGEIDLRSERMDLRVRGQDKSFRLVRVMVPVTAKGPLTAPRVGVEPGPALAQGGVAAALGTMLSPLAAILPFVDPGLAKDANCGALIAEASRDGAPVKTATTAAR